MREAIEAANSRTGADAINFNIPDTQCAGGVCKISPNFPGLPMITDPVTINGYSQPGSRPNSLAVGNNAVLEIELDGSASGGVGLWIAVGSSTVRGLVINDFSNVGVRIDTRGGNTIAGNFIGTDAGSTLDRGNGLGGLIIVDSSDNTMGGTTSAARTVSSPATSRRA